MLNNFTGCCIMPSCSAFKNGAFDLDFVVLSYEMQILCFDVCILNWSLNKYDNNYANKGIHIFSKLVLTCLICLFMFARLNCPYNSIASTWRQCVVFKPWIFFVMQVIAIIIWMNKLLTTSKFLLFMFWIDIYPW